MTQINYVLARTGRGKECTFGEFYKEGSIGIKAFVLEDEDRGLNQSMSLAEIAKKKVAGKTAIPYGRYRLRVTWSPKFGRMMPEVQDVPGYVGIRCHGGNTKEDTLGCPLLGLKKEEEKNRVYDCKKVNDDLTKELLLLEKQGFETFLVVKPLPGYLQ